MLRPIMASASAGHRYIRSTDNGRSATVTQAHPLTEGMYLAEGMYIVLVNGECAWRDSRHAGALRGRCGKGRVTGYRAAP